jgi:hypothetical protein
VAARSGDPAHQSAAQLTPKAREQLVKMLKKNNVFRKVIQGSNQDKTRFAYDEEMQI